MNKIFLISLIFFILLTNANAEKPYNCVDSHGNRIITTSPQDGMKCETEKSDEKKSSPKISFRNQNSSSENLIDICDNFYRASEEISAEIQSYDDRRSELKKMQFEIRQESVRNSWDYKTEAEASKSIREEQNNINKEISLLYEKKSLISDDIRKYKCDQLKQDLSRINQSSGTMNNSIKSPRGRTVIMRGGGRSLIYRD